MNQNHESATNQIFSLKPQRPFEEVVFDLQEGRRNMAFDFCFQMYYPSLEEDNLRNCIY